MDEETKKKVMQERRESPEEFADARKASPDEVVAMKKELKDAAASVFEQIRGKSLRAAAEMARRWGKLLAHRSAGRAARGDTTGAMSDEGAAVIMREFSEYILASIGEPPVEAAAILYQLPELREMSSCDSPIGQDEAFERACKLAETP